MKQPVPQGKYVPAVRHADVIYTSGMTPLKAGELIYFCKIRASEPIETYRDAVRLTTVNAVVAAQACLQEGESISRILQLSIFLNAEQGFTAHSKIADYASDVLMERLGVNSLGSRVAVGVATLPSDAPVEVVLIGSVV